MLSRDADACETRESKHKIADSKAELPTCITYVLPVLMMVMLIL